MNARRLADIHFSSILTVGKSVEFLIKSRLSLSAKVQMLPGRRVELRREDLIEQIRTALIHPQILRQKGRNSFGETHNASFV